MDKTRTQNKKVASKKKKKFSIKMLMFFILFEIIFTAATGPFFLYYGPFNNVKKTVVGTAMATMSHQYIATLFLSKERIAEILKDDVQPVSTTVVSQITGKVNVPTKHDDTIIRKNISGKRFDAYLLEINDPTRINVGYTKKIGQEGEKTSQIAKDNNAIAAVNGGGFTDQSTDGKLWAGTGAIPTGFVMADGKVIHNDTGNETTKTSVMGMTNKGMLIIGDHSIKDLKALGVTDAISFGPPLVLNGKGQIRGDGGQGTNPRTAIGQTQDGTILLLVVDGRQGLTKPGATLKEVEEIMLQYGAVNATNLDGGSSTTMYYDGEIINDPCDPLGERSVATAVYVKP